MRPSSAPSAKYAAAQVDQPFDAFHPQPDGVLHCQQLGATAASTAGSSSTTMIAGRDRV